MTSRNRNTVDEFVRLANLSRVRKLKPAEVKRFARLQTQLMRSGAVVPLTQKLVRNQARALYKALPWWRKALLRVRYHWRATGARFEVLRMRLRLRLPRS